MAENTGKMKEIFTYVAGNALGVHQKFLELLKGVKEVESPEKNIVTIVFCPIVSRFESDISSALSSISDECGEVIVVAMHHTFDKRYILPHHGGLSHPKVTLVVDCLFFETKGLLKCPCNEKAVEMVCKKLGLQKTRWWKKIGEREKEKKTSRHQDVLFF